MIRPEDVSIDESQSLGTGKTYKATYGNQVAAVKILAEEVALEALRARSSLWQSLDHPNVLHIFGVSSEEADPLFIVMDVASGMQYIHSRGLIHGGLKTSEILIKADGQACIADYGMSEIQSTKNNEAHRYFSPEAWKGMTSKPSDVYAFAMCAFEIFTSTPPWGILPEKHIIRMVCHEDVRPDRPEYSWTVRVGMTDQMWDIIEESWHKEARLRPTFDIIVRLWEAATQGTIGNGSQSGSDRGKLNATPNRRLRVQNPTSPALEDEHDLPPAYEPSGAGIGYNGRITKQPLPSSAKKSTFSGLTPPSSSAPTVQTFDNKIRPLNVVRPPNIQPENLHPGYGAQSHPRHTVSPPPSDDGYDSVPESHYQQGQSVVPSNSLGVSRSLTVSTGFSRLSMNPRTGSDLRSISDVGSIGGSSNSGAANPVLVAQALQVEVKERRNPRAIDECLTKIYLLASQSDKLAQKLITAGVIPTLILLLKTRAAADEPLETVLIALGTLAYDSLSANTIYRTDTTTTLMELFSSSESDDVAALALWTITRLIRTTEIAQGLLKRNLAKQLVDRGLHGGLRGATLSAWCLGNLIQNDAIADSLAEQGFITDIVDHLRHSTNLVASTAEDISSGLFVVARMSRSIKLAKQLAKAGCVDLLAHHLNTSTESSVLHWSARAVGCLMRPNSSDMSKILLQKGTAAGLARFPSVLPTEEVEPLASFAFAIQRFSCAEWGGGTRKALVDAGVVDSLLAALRTAADEPYPQVHIELALAVSFLGDVGGSTIRKEIVNAGGVKILKDLAQNGEPEVKKACNMAATSIAGNIWTRNAASAKTAMNHNWSGGCPEYHPPCPVQYDFGEVTICPEIYGKERARPLPTHFTSTARLEREALHLREHKIAPRRILAGQLNDDDSASGSGNAYDSEAGLNTIKIEEISPLTYSETCLQTGAPFFTPVMPIPRVPMAIDHDEEKTYLLPSHDNSEDGPGSALHCLDVKAKTWDDSVQNLTFSNQCSCNTKVMPSFCGAGIPVMKIGSEKYIFIIGGYFSSPERPERWSSFNTYLTILYIKLSTKEWGVFRYCRRCPVAISTRGCKPLITHSTFFGGMQKLPKDLEDYDNNWQYFAEDIVDSFSVLQFDQEGGALGLDHGESALPASRRSTRLRYGPMNYGNEVQIFLSVGMKGNCSPINLDPEECLPSKAAHALILETRTTYTPGLTHRPVKECSIVARGINYTS
ncbi:hypothetical protein WG66_006876 [Moniliophthora roreri]|nr:hypothetical protein WG66_006876 [Moniliophthora roreri]